MIDFTGVLPPEADRIELTPEVHAVDPAMAGFCVGSILRANTEPGVDLEELIRPAAQVEFAGSDLGVFLKSVTIAGIRSRTCLEV